MMDIPYDLRTRIMQLIDDYLESVEVTGESVEFEYCPKCGIVHPRTVKSGKTRKGKQMYRCKHCGKRFVEDHGKLTFYSHKDASFWAKVIDDTVHKASSYETSREMQASRNTILSMRHKVLVFLEEARKNTEIQENMQMDEKYLLGSHKGVHVPGIHSRTNGEKSSKRGLNKEQACIICCVGKDGDTYAETLNAGLMGKEDLRKFSHHVARGSNITTDGNATYDLLCRIRQANRFVCTNCKDHRADVNLNAVNSFHSMIGEMNRKYRGVATKYLNRYNTLFSCIWKHFTHRRETEDSMKVFGSITKNVNIVVTRKELMDYNLLVLPDLEWTREPIAS